MSFVIPSIQEGQR